jgi:subtilisin family serine protease
VLVALLAAVNGPALYAAVVDDIPAPAALVRGDSHRPDELLVKFRSGANSVRTQPLVAAHGATAIREFRHSARRRQGPIDRWRMVHFPPGADLSRVRAALLRDPLVEHVEYNYEVRIQRTPNDPNFGRLWGLHNIGQTGGRVDADIDAQEAWDEHTGDPGVVVAVIDTGVAYDHPDLARNIWVNPGEIPGNGIDDDGNGYVDDVHGYDFANADADPYDDHGHGTHVAGTIAAVGDNGIGVTGVSWNARIMAVKFLNAAGSGTTSGAISAVLYAVDMGAKVMNSSWGGGGFSQALMDAIRAADDAGVLFIAAAGNLNINNDLVPNYPPNYEVANVVAVAATDHNDAKASFSDYGAKTVHLGAPGVSIYSTVPTTGHLCCSNATGYGLLSGTSMATPHVSGAAALLFGRFPGINHYQVRDRLLSNTDPIGALTTVTVTGGRLNVVRAMERDEVPPASVLDLTSAAAGSHTVKLRWSASGDDGAVGTAWSYDLRYALFPIDAANFDQATAVGGTPKPASPGAHESFDVTGLDPGTRYFFALRVRDNVGNASPLSNVISVRTRPAAIVFRDNMESGPSNWTIAGSDGVGGPALWHLSTHRANSPATAFYYGKEDTLNYSTGGRNFGSITSVPIDLGARTDSSLSFTHFLRTESVPPHDTARVQVSSDSGATWSDVYVTSLSTAGMVRQDINLSAYDGRVILLRFSFDTGDSVFNAFEGWVIDDVTVTVTAPNQPPVANAGGPYFGFRNQPITYTGSASDADGDALTFGWDFGDGSTGTGATPAHAYSALGTYTATLVVNDGEANSARASATVTIQNQRPLAAAGEDRSVHEKTRVFLNGTASVDPDGSIVGYRWRQISGPSVRLDNAARAVADFRAPKPGHGSAQLGFELTVIDNDGGTAVDQLVITVTR